MAPFSSKRQGTKSNKYVKSDENKLHFVEMIMMSAFFYTNTLNLNFKVLAN